MCQPERSEGSGFSRIFPSKILRFAQDDKKRQFFFVMVLGLRSYYYDNSRYPKWDSHCKTPGPQSNFITLRSSFWLCG
jgi:hypothetical protein